MIGDTEQKKLLQATLTTTNTESQITNPGATYKTTITSITACLQDGATTKRHISGYLYGSAAGNQFLSFDLDPSDSVNEVLTGLDYVLSVSEIMCFKQDAGADVNITIQGISEVIA